MKKHHQLTIPPHTITTFKRPRLKTEYTRKINDDSCSRCKIKFRTVSKQRYNQSTLQTQAQSPTKKNFKITKRQIKSSILPQQTSKKPQINSGLGKYKLDGLVGKGTFGTIYLGHAIGTKARVAIKKVFQDQRYKNRQLKIMKMIKNPFIIEMHEYFYLQDKGREYLNIVMDYYPTNLHQLIKRKRMAFSQIKIYLYQILCALNHLKTHFIAHRDLKPENILIDPLKNKAVLCDFGSAKQIFSGEENIAYVGARHYRAPQLLYHSVNYGVEMDMWSLGCVLVEMINGKPLFKGATQVDQIVEIVRVLGSPTKQEMKEMNKNYDVKTYGKFPTVKAQSWKNILKTENTQLIDLIEKMLQYSPDRRITPAKAIMHEYFDELRNCSLMQSMLWKQKQLPNLICFSEEQLNQFVKDKVPMPNRLYYN